MQRALVLLVGGASACGGGGSQPVFDDASPGVTRTLTVVAAGPAPFQLTVTGANPDFVASCQSSCAIPVVTGQEIQVEVESPEVITSITGPGIAGNISDFTVLGDITFVVTTKFSDHVVASVVVPGAIDSGGVTSTGDYIIGTRGKVERIDPLGNVQWSQPVAPAAPVEVVVGADDSVAAWTHDTVTRLGADGLILWTHTATPMDGRSGTLKNLAVAPDGDVAFIDADDTAVTVLSPAGDVRWSVVIPAETPEGVLYDDAGNLTVIVDPGPPPFDDYVSAHRYDGDGNEAGFIPAVDNFELVVSYGTDHAGRILAIEGDTNNYGLTRVDYAGQYTIDSQEVVGAVADSTPIMVIAGADDSVWWSTSDGGVDANVVHRYNPDGTFAWGVERLGTDAEMAIEELAALPNGNVVGFGSYSGYGGGLIETFAP